MENLMIMGINTRPFVNSALKLNYNTYSISYFKTLDFNLPFLHEYILHQELIESDDFFDCGSFEDNYSPIKLLDLAKDYFDEIDKIVFSTGISANDFKGEFSKFKNKIYGNIKTDSVNDKFKFYNKLKNKFNIPLTFRPNDVYEVIEIAEQHPTIQFILKPLQGSGGYGIFLLNKQTLNHFKESIQDYQFIGDNYIMQEYIFGVNLSSSVLSTKSESKNIINTRLLTEDDLGIKNSFVYSGNILPLTYESFYKFNNHFKSNKYDNFDFSNEDNKEFNKIVDAMENVSEDLISYFKLIGSNGVDFILSNSNVRCKNNNSIDENDLYVIEVNPRFQGTYESCEEVLGINLLDAHIKACEGELIDIPKLDNDSMKYVLKKIVYAKNPIVVGDLQFENVYDIPYKNVKIEKNQPIVTLLNSNSNLEKAIFDLNNNEEKINKNIKYY